MFGSRTGLARSIEMDNSPYFVLHMKEAMKRFHGHPLFPPSHVDAVGD